MKIVFNKETNIRRLENWIRCDDYIESDPEKEHCNDMKRELPGS